ncbi:MAG TPA: glycosyltransferase family 39 protein [Bryobacteraceae bacterium]|nr:glycosyltransferase family 39 protein [Bryobacteraceae bacterium]
MRLAKPLYPLICLALLAAWSAAAVSFFYSKGELFAYGDAEAHLNMARRVFDSRTPGYDQIGRIWLPLPHLLMLPLARIDSLWHSGLAGSLPSAACFVAAGAFLFGATAGIFDSVAAAATSAAVFAANPNLLYLQSTAMTEPVFAACLMALLFFSVRFRRTQSWLCAAAAGAAAALGALSRYEGWFVIPFAAAYFLWAARNKRLVFAALFSAIAVLGPALWLAHNWWLTGDPLDFFRGPNSPAAIQGGASYPGHGNWRMAFLYFRTAAALCAGPALGWIGLAGALAALLKRAFWPLLLLALPGVFYIWSMHSAATPIFVPTLWPNSYYNTRYGLAVLPLLALAAGALVALAPVRVQTWVAVIVIAASITPWLIPPSRGRWVVWQEAQINSQGRREWTREAAGYLRSRYVPGGGIITSFGDLTGIFRAMDLPLRETFTADNGLPWQATIRRPDLFLWQEWAVVMGGDPVQTALNRAGRYGIRYRLEKMIVAGRDPVIEIYRRIGGPRVSISEPEPAGSEPPESPEPQ